MSIVLWLTILLAPSLVGAHPAVFAEHDVVDEKAACDGHVTPIAITPYRTYCRMIGHAGDTASFIRPTIEVELPQDRSQLGTLRLLDYRGRQIFGPVAVLARANAALAKEHNNPTRNHLELYGDAPTGSFKGVALAGPSLRVLRPDISDIGAGLVVALLDPEYSYKRPAIFIEGGDPSRTGRLRPTAGGIRMRDRDIGALIRLIQMADAGVLDSRKPDVEFARKAAQDGIVPGLPITQDAAVDITIVERARRRTEHLWGIPGPSVDADQRSDLPEAVTDPLPVPTYSQYVSAYLSSPPAGTVSHGVVVAYQNGLTYVGDTINDVPNGSGSLKFRTSLNDKMYDVEFKGTFRRGYYVSGTMSSNRQSWTGAFVAGLPNGVGVLKTADFELHATWLDGLPEGSGTFQRAHWGSCTVHLVHGDTEGNTACTFTNGDTFVGSFRHWTMDGIGLYTCKSGDTYNGRYVAGTPNGHGTYKWPNGDTFEGNFLAGRRDGQGTYHRHDGQVFQGTWVNDSPAAVAPRYPIVKQQDDDTGQGTVGDGHHMMTRIVIGIDGDVQGTTTIDNHVWLTGFCGKVAVQGFDASGKVIWRGGPGAGIQWCVDGSHVFWGNSMRRDRWSGRVPLDALPNLASLAIIDTQGSSSPEVPDSSIIQGIAGIVTRNDGGSNTNSGSDGFNSTYTGEQ